MTPSYWPKPYRDIYEFYADLIDAIPGNDGGSDSVLNYGPGHIIWCDENFEAGHIEWCCDFADERRETLYVDLSDAEIDLVKQSLRALRYHL